MSAHRHAQGEGPVTMQMEQGRGGAATHPPVWPVPLDAQDPGS